MKIQNGDYRHELKRCSCVSYDGDLFYGSNGLFDTNVHKEAKEEVKPVSKPFLRFK